tara:strand:+ start:87 stop:350 length:264 start_codon:yes stop_codon:yes gene_type:complete
MKQQIKRAKKNLQDALELISEDDIEKDLLHDYILDALKAVENLNLDDVSNRRELLIDFAEKVYRRVFFTWDKKTSEKVVDEYIKGNL